ncbi:MAG: dienelactone hydrolase family protein [Bacteroidia bacterium]|nr:dienelactone hydrolase family protein [Bacteroidia bacterium]
MRITTCIILTLLFVSCTPNDPYPYISYEPQGYDGTQDISLMIFLHGAGERGEDLSKVSVHGPPKLVAEGKDFPCLILSPQCPENVWWQIPRLEATLDEFLSSHTIDKKRIYLTGLSMGGYGTWEWARQFPDKFAAIAPICGGLESGNVEPLKDIPIWAFHGAKDEVVPLEESTKVIEAIKELGGQPQYTIYPEANHDSWTATYADSTFYNWFFFQHRQ